MADSSESKTPLLQRVLNRDMTSMWSKYHTSGILDDEGVMTLRDYVDARTVEQRADLLKKSNAPKVLKHLLELHEVSVIQYVLALIDQALQYQPALSQFFADPRIFLPLIKNEEFQQDQFICWKSCRILSHLFTTIDSKANEEHIKEFLSTMLSSLLMKQQEAVLFSLQLLLRKSELRQHFIRADGTMRLRFLLNKDAPVQLQYQMIFCIWLVSFEKPLAPELESVVHRIVDIARQSQKEKVMRISLAALRNLASEPVNVERMVEAKLNKQLEIWNNRRWGDEEIVADLAFLTKTVERMLDEMSSFERYRAEVLSGDLEWTPVHFSESFWRDNITKLAEDNFHLIRVLSELLGNSATKPLTKAVACYDVGEFVRLHPAGRKVVTELGTKSTVMSILYETNPDPEVQKQALLCTRKMMVSSW